jgi:hypothetical protein
MAPGHAVPAWARKTFGGRPVVYVSGNHELYGQVLQTAEAQLQDEAQAHGVHWLQCAGVVIGGVRFLGCTLWTDLRLPILYRCTGELRSNADLAMSEAQDRLADFDAISFRSRSPRALAGGRGGAGPWRPLDMLRTHYAHRRWLAAALAVPFDGPTVVVTHHAPSLQSVVERWRDDPLSACYASQLPRRFFSVPSLWVHGHTHTSHRYRIGRCQVVCNPRGYPWQMDPHSGRFQNPAWCERGGGVEVDTATRRVDVSRVAT